MTYVLQTQAVALVASLAGAALGLAVQPVLAAALAGLVPFTLEPRPQVWTLVRAIAMGLRHHAALHVGAAGRGALGSAVAGAAPGRERRRGAVPAARSRSCRSSRASPRSPSGRPARSRSAQSSWGPRSPRCSRCGRLARVVIASARADSRARGLAWRHGVAALARPGSHAPRVVVALGIAVMLLVTVALLQGVLGRQIDHERRQDRRPSSSSTSSRISASRSRASWGRPPARRRS